MFGGLEWGDSPSSNVEGYVCLSDFDLPRVRAFREDEKEKKITDYKQYFFGISLFFARLVACYVLFTHWVKTTKQSRLV